MADQRWEVRILDEDSEDVEKEQITQVEVRTTAPDKASATERALALVRAEVPGVAKHRLKVTNVAEIWKSKL
jgi:hypothetical protein